jgi:ring-1,2-phenylacetyl-CoA epoxidase subunit PaaA
MDTTAHSGTEQVVVNNPEEFSRMPDEYRELVVRQMMVHTEGELTGADDYVQIFYPMAPNAYEKQVCCERAAEEVNHYILGAKLLADIGVDTGYMLGQSIAERNLYATEIVKEVNNWAERGFFSFLGEAAVLAQLLEMSESSYRPIGEMLESVVKDEKIHVAHGYRIIRDMCKTEDGRAEAQQALERMWPATLDVFGRTDSRRSRLYLQWGLRKYANDEARRRFSEKTRPKLQELGLRVPDDGANRKYV